MNQNIYTWVLNLYGYAMSKFLPTGRFKWIDPKELDTNKYTCISSKGRVLEADRKYPKELMELHNDYLLPLDKTEIKKDLSKYQLMIFVFYNIPIGNIKKLVPNFFDKGMYVLHCENLQLYLRLGLKLKKYITNQNSVHHQWQWVKPCVEFNTKKNRCRKKILTKMEKRCIN